MKYYYNLGLFFEDIASQFNNNIAIKYQNEKYTYAQLNEKANAFANFLVEQKIGQGDVLAIINTKEFDSLALMLACLKIGVAYANIDIDSPAIRVKKTFQQCRPKIVFFDKDSKDISRVCNELNIKHYFLYELSRIIGEFDTTDLDIVRKVDGSTIAYIMFTSGSTGIPKGVAITHQNVIHLINWSISFYKVNHNDVFTNVSPLYFDNSVFDFYSALFSGASLVPVKKELLTEPLQLLKTIDELKCTIWFSVPSLLIYLMTMKALNTNTFKSIRIIAFGGEGYPKSELVKLYNLYKKRIKFVNVYGPTECTCICSAYLIQENDFNELVGLPPLGELNQNFNYLIIDDNGEENSEGELYLLGPNMGAGYYNNQEKTKEVFIECDHGRFYLKKMYKTGDIVKETNGVLYFVGRKDNQIKHLGYRIELEEIEAALNIIEGINQSAVIYQRVNPSFGKIIAFIATKKDIDQNYIGEELKKALPSYMLPNKIKILTSLPKNPNGKVDKKILFDNIEQER